MHGDLLGAALGSDVLRARQRRAATIARQRDQVLGDEWYGSAGAPLPRRIGRRVDDDLTDDSPTRVVRVTAGDQKTRQGFGHAHCARLGRMAVKMP